jgi:hypothetical protein
LECKVVRVNTKVLLVVVLDVENSKLLVKLCCCGGVKPMDLKNGEIGRWHCWKEVESMGLSHTLFGYCWKALDE